MILVITTSLSTAYAATRNVTNPHTSHLGTTFSITTNHVTTQAKGISEAHSTILRPLAACYASSCNNKDPYQPGCNSNAKDVGDKSVYSQPANTFLFTVENWYSYSCNANWNVSVVSKYSFESGGVELSVRMDTSPYTFVSFSYGGPNLPVWSNMVDGTHTVNACTSADTYTGCVDR